MVQTIINRIHDTVTDMTWVDRYAGLTEMITRESKDTGKESYPVSCSVDMKKCWENNQYLDLMPNSTYKSVVYWEAHSGLALVDKRKLSGGRQINVYETNVRLVTWLNMKKLGYDKLEGTHKMQQDVMRSLNGLTIGKETINGILILGADFELTEVMKRDHVAIFGKYHYGSKVDLFMYPFDFFALNFRIRMELNHDCVPALAASAAIQC